MKQISIIDRINRRRIFTFSALVLVSLVLASVLVSKNPGPTQAAFTFNANQLIVAANDVLYIGAGGLQSERVWGDTTLYTNEISYSRADTRKDNSYILQPRTTPAPANSEYGLGDMITMNYGETGGCPRINSNTDTLNEYTGGQRVTGACNAIITDGGGAIIRVRDDITINGNVFLGDRVVLIAGGTITLGPNGRIIGSGQKGGSAEGHDFSAFGGIGAHNGGSAPAIQAYNSDGKTCGGPNFNTTQTDYCPTFVYPPPNTRWNPFILNGLSYYDPLAATNSYIDPFFRDSNGNNMNGGAGSFGSVSKSTVDEGHPLDYYDRGAPYGGTFGIGQAGGSGSALGPTSGLDESGGGGGGGGGYGIVLQAQDIETDYHSNITVQGGDYGVQSDTGGKGGPGGGGVVIMRGASVRPYGHVYIDGGLGSTTGERDSINAQPGTYRIENLQTNFSIKKRLIAINRPSAIPVNNFNPYALQLDDIIQVEIRATQLTPPLTLTDSFLALGGNITNSVYCDPSTRDGTPLRVGLDLGVTVDRNGGTVSWTMNTPQAEYTQTYYCKVIRRR